MIDYYSTLIKLLPNTSLVQALVIDKKGSVPTEVGAKMLVAMSGLVCGTIGGGALEKRAIEHCIILLQKSSNGNSSRHKLINWDLKKDLGKTCGGSITLFFEVMGNSKWQIVIFGAGHVGIAVSKILTALNCHITCVDFREEWLNQLPASEKLLKVKLDDMAEYVDKIPKSAFVLIMTIGHKTDFEILSKCLNKGFPFLGVIGSKQKAAFIKQQLKLNGLQEGLESKYHCPVGLPIGTNEPQEIAISIVAQLLMERDKLQNSKHWKDNNSVLELQNSF